MMKKNEDKIKKEVKPEKKVILSAEQERIASLTEQAPKDFPNIEITSFKYQNELRIPESVKLPEYAYRYINVNNLENVLTDHGGIFQIVNRHNHSHAPSSLFGITGAITFKRQNILCFTRRDIAEKIHNQNIRDFNKKTERALNEQQEYGGGKIRLESVENPEGGRNDIELMTDDDYDAPSPS